VTELQDAKAHVLRLRAAVEEARVELDRTRPGYLTPEQRAAAEEFDARREAVLDKFRRQVSAIEV
jgi:hypothetical protein